MKARDVLLVLAGGAVALVVTGVVLVAVDGDTAPSPTPTTAPIQANCHPSYQGACLNPNASDYDCAGGTGDGPFFTGRVIVVGQDVFRLDHDNDGIGCE